MTGTLKLGGIVVHRVHPTPRGAPAPTDLYVMSQPSKPNGRIGIREVAASAGVAISSVSRVLADNPDVSDAMRGRVMAAVEELGYRPDMLAQGLRSRRTLSVGFVVGDISNPLLAEISGGVERELRDAGYSMLLTNSDGDPRRDAENIELLSRRRVDGLLLSPASERSTVMHDALRAVDVPVVVIDRSLPAKLGASAVLSDHRSGVTAATNHLLDLGHRRIGVILGQPVRPTVERRAAVRDAYAARGLEPEFRVIAGGTFSAAFGAQGMELLLESEPRVTAIVAGGNQLLIGALEVLREHDLRVGRDMSVVSCDDIALTDLFDPPISVIRRDTRALGTAAARLLLKKLAQPSGREQVVLGTEYVPRASCARPSS